MLVSKVSLSEGVVCNSVLFCSFVGAVEAGIAHGLKKRAAGLLPAQDTQSVLLKLAKLSEPAAELVKKLSGEEDANKDGKSTMPGTEKIIEFCLLLPSKSLERPMSVFSQQQQYFIKRKGYKNSQNDYQSCVLAEPGGPLGPNFCSWATKKSSVFSYKIIMLGTLDFTGSEHWAPFDFP